MSLLVSLPTPPRRILIIKPSSLGDVVHALPILPMLRKRWPDASIAWLVAPYCAGLLPGRPLLDEIILFDRRRFGQAWYNPAALLDLLRFHRDLRRRTFDLVIDLQGLFRSGYFTRWTGAPIRVGFDNAREGAPFFYTDRVPIETVEQHALDRYLRIAAALGCDTSQVSFPFQVSDGDRWHVDSLIPAGTRYAVLLPGTNWPTKRWPAENFEAMVRPLRERFGLASVLAGGADAAELAPRIPGAKNLTGQTTLPQLVALLERADLVIANDSGPMHIASALGRPLVTLFGPTNPVRTGPWRRMECVVRLDMPCSPCYSRHCSHQSCLRWLGVEEVLKVAEEQIGRSAGENVVYPANSSMI